MGLKEREAMLGRTQGKCRRDIDKRERETDRQRDREREKSYANDHAKEGEKNVPTTVLMDPTEPRNHTIPLELCS